MSTYSGITQPGWNYEGTYDRIQFSGQRNCDQIPNLIQEGLEIQEASQRTRLDLRIKTAITRKQIAKLLTDFPDLEFSALFDQSKEDQTAEITVCRNMGVRKTNPNITSRLIDQVQRDIHKYRLNFQETTEQAIAQINDQRLTLVSEGFQADEIFRLWNTTFGWTLAQCQDAVTHSSQDAEIYGLRAKDGTLIAITLVSTSGNLSESTEWAVCPKYQGQGLITPLLIYSNAMTIANRPQNEVWAHLRIGRSVTPAVRTGMQICLPENRTGVLVNHVTVGNEEQPEEYNQDITPINGINERALRSFVTGQVDKRLYTPAIINAFTNN